MAVATAHKTADSKHNIEAMREAYYERIAKYDMAPLWKVMKSVVTKEPVTHVAPAIWRFADAKALVLESGPLISAEDGMAAMKKAATSGYNPPRSRRLSLPPSDQTAKLRSRAPISRARSEALLMRKI